jgi:protein SCO1
MSTLSGLVWLLLGCGGGETFIVEGTVVEVRPPDEVVLDHEPIPGLGMDAMVMPFDVAAPAMLEGLRPGSKVVARYRVSEAGSELVRIRVTGHGPAPELASGPVPLRVGQRIADTRLAAQDGSAMVLGAGQGERVALTFIYTRCPKPEFCPAIVGRLAALDQALGEAEGVRLVAVTLDPAFDTPEVLSAYAAQVGASERWRFARVEGEEGALDDLAMRAGLPVMRDLPGAPGEIGHGVRLLVLDRDGTLIERYDDTRFPLDRVVQQLTTGRPTGDPRNSGTSTPAPAR